MLCKVCAISFPLSRNFPLCGKWFKGYDSGARSSRPRRTWSSRRTPQVKASRPMKRNPAKKAGYRLLPATATGALVACCHNHNTQHTTHKGHTTHNTQHTALYNSQCPVRILPTADGLISNAVHWHWQLSR
jgi:hypothetical protein